MTQSTPPCGVRTGQTLVGMSPVIRVPVTLPQLRHTALPDLAGPHLRDSLLDLVGSALYHPEDLAELADSDQHLIAILQLVRDQQTESAVSADQLQALQVQLEDLQQQVEAKNQEIAALREAQAEARLERDRYQQQAETFCAAYQREAAAAIGHARRAQRLLELNHDAEAARRCMIADCAALVAELAEQDRLIKTFDRAAKRVTGMSVAELAARFKERAHVNVPPADSAAFDEPQWCAQGTDPSNETVVMDIDLPGEQA
jgi:hypothetical protein